MTGRLAVATATLALLVVLSVTLISDPPQPLTILLAGNLALLLLVALDVALAPSVKELALSRDGDRKVRLGEVAQTSLSVTNTGPRRWRGWLRDAWVPTAGAHLVGAHSDAGRDDRAAINIPPGAALTLDVHLRPTRRGNRPADRVTLRSIGPLGLAGRQGSVRVPWSIRTLPSFSSRRYLPSRLARLRDMDGRQAIAVRAQGTEFDSLREYVPGDDVRTIDWRATARAADVMVRTWRPERDRRVVLVLDTGRTSAARIGDETRLDLLMDASLLLTALAERAGDRVSVLAFDRNTRMEVIGGTGIGQLPTLVDAMADLEPQLIETDYRGLVSAVLRRVRKQALVVLLSGLDRASMSEGLLPALPALTSRHTVVVASARPPDTAPARYDIETAYQGASLARAATDRNWVSTRLARLGVVVVDAEPERIAPKLADIYLDLKASGRL